jgi:hypothetical protein
VVLCYSLACTIKLSGVKLVGLGHLVGDIVVVQSAPLRHQGGVTCKDTSRRVYSIDSMASCIAIDSKKER